jgi:O-succinylbenzoate synthase
MKWGVKADIEQVFHDAEYLKVVVLDKEKFLKRGEAVMMLVWDEELKGWDEVVPVVMECRETGEEVIKIISEWSFGFCLI